MENFKKRILGDVKTNLYTALEMLMSSYELFEPIKNRELIENILFLGMRKRLEDITEGRTSDEKSI